MKRSLLACCAGLALLVACNNVDKDGTADKLIDDIERIQAVKLDVVQRECIDGLVKSYSDEDLRKLAKNTGTEQLTNDFAGKLEACVRGGAVATTTVAGAPTTVVDAATTVVDTATTVAALPSEVPTSVAG